MRVLHLSTAASWRGGEQQIAYLLEELRGQGLQQHIICRRDSAMADYCRRNRFPVSEAARSGSLDLRYSYQVAAELKRAGRQVVHAHDSHAHSLALYSHLFRRQSIPLIVSRRVDFPIGRSWLTRWKYAHPDVRRILCVSDSIQQIMRQSLPAERLVTVYSGIDLSRFAVPADGRLRREFAIPREKRLVGNVAALAPHKDYFTFVDVAAQLLQRRSDLHFVAIGDGPQRKGIERYIRERELQESITLTGFRDDIPHILPELDVFMITSRTEGLGTSVLDAFAAGVAVVATNAGGIGEMVQHDSTGLLAEAGDSDGLAIAVERYLDDPQLCRRMVDGARQRVQQFRKEVTAQQTLAVYREVAGG